MRLNGTISLTEDDLRAIVAGWFNSGEIGKVDEGDITFVYNNQDGTVSATANLVFETYA